MNSDLPIRAGIFETEPAADRAVAGLIAAGFSKEKISVVSSRPVEQPVEHEDVVTVEPSGSHTGGAVVLGGSIGTVLGGLATVVGVAATGGIGLVVVGPLLAAAAAGGVAGGFVGAMMSRGFEPEIADFYDQALSKGQYLVAVEDVAEGPGLESAEAVFESAGATPMAMGKG
jgi:hypothetical protein